MGKTRYFEAKCVNISKTVGYTSKLLLITNRKLHMRFRLKPRSMTLDDLELYKFEFSDFRGILQIWEATTVKRMKIDPYRQRQRCNPLYVGLLFGIMFIA